MATPATFSWSPLIGTSGTATFRLLKAQFGDGYAQDAADGINNKLESWPVQFQGNLAEMTPIKQFLDFHQGYKAFYWTPPMGVQGLYKATSYSINAIDGVNWNISVTFTEAFKP